MLKRFFALWARLIGKNTQSTPTSVIADQLLEPRPLPMGMEEFDAWSDRILAGACVPHKDPEAFKRSSRFTLATLIMHLGPTESHKPDAYFIHCLRKGAVNQVAYGLMAAAQEEKKLREAQLKAASDAMMAEARETTKLTSVV